MLFVKDAELYEVIHLEALEISMWKEKILKKIDRVISYVNSAGINNVGEIASLTISGGMIH